MRKNKLITRRIINWGFVAAACLLVLIYLWDWYNLPWILHAEINNDISSFLAGDSVGIKDFIAKIFDMRVIERTNQGGAYRPRILAFAVQYTDIKLWILFNRITNFGARWPLSILASLFLVSGCSGIIRFLFPSLGKAESFLFGACFLYVPQFVASSFLFLRSAKVLSPAVAVWIIAWFLKNMKKRNSLDILWGIVISMLLTLDEQLIGVVGIMLGYSILLFLFQKTHRNNIRVAVYSLLSYFLFYFTWGRWLCMYFSGGVLVRHPHSYSNVIYLYRYLIPALETYYQALKRLVFDSRGVLILICLFYFVMLVRLLIKREFIHTLISIYFICAGYIFSLLIVTEHPVVARLPELPQSMYFSISVFWFMLGFGYAASRQLIEKNKYIVLLGRMIGMLLLFNSIYVQYNIKEYELTNATEGGVFMHNDMSALLENENIKKAGIDITYFSGALINEEDYKRYLDSD